MDYSDVLFFSFPASKEKEGERRGNGGQGGGKVYFS